MKRLSCPAALALSLAFAALIFTFVSSTARAGLFEIGASGSYKKSNIDVDAYDESTSITGSLAYYLTEASALELSYTDGTNKRVISEGVPNGHTTFLYYKTVGIDLIYTFGAKDAVVRPYVKAGTNYILQKRIVDQYRAADGTLFPAYVLDDTPGFVPSAGAGFRIGLTESLALKVGVDGWTSRPLSAPPVTVDWFGRAGLSWFF
jgi:outer membrane protein W